MTNSTNRLIHVAKIQENFFKYLFLREKEPNYFIWSEDENGIEKETALFGTTIEDAISKARKEYKSKGFKTVNCGYRYTLPERDEHGTNALFFQMKESYSTSNGVYFDETLGNLCHVQFASLEAQNLLKKLKQENRL